MQRKIILPKPLFIEKSSRAVLLLHGYTGSTNDVRMLSRWLEKKEYTVYSPNFSGHGTLAPEDILAESPAVWWQDTLEAIEFLKDKGYREIAVLGLSMGGLMATHALTKKIDGLVGGGFFCSPIFPSTKNVPKNFMLYANEALRLAGEEETVKEERLAKMEPKMLKQLEGIDKLSEQTTENLREIHVPVFIAQGGQDEMIVPENVFKTVQQLKQTRVTLQWYPNSKHVITIGKDHKQFEQDVSSFLDTLSWSEERE